VNEIYDDMSCPGTCSPARAIATGTPIPVTLGETTSGRDLSLDLGGSIRGTVTDASSGNPVQGVSVQVYSLAGSTPISAGSASTNASGEYAVGGLPTGTYYAFTSNSVGHVNEIYDDIQCPMFCSEFTATQSGAQIPVTVGATTSGRHFVLDRGGSISGTLIDAGTSQPVSGLVGVVLGVDAAPFSLFTMFVIANASGQFTARGLPAGSYRLYSNIPNYVNEIYDGMACLGSCSAATAWSTGTPVTVGPGMTITGRDFALSPGGVISGNVTDEMTSAPIFGVSVAVYALSLGQATLVRSASTTASGAYAVTGLPSGTYIAATQGPTNYRHEVFDNIPCPESSCPTSVILSGTPIAVAAGSTSSGRNFALSPRDAIRGTVIAEGSGAPLSNVTVSVYNRTTGTLAGSASSNALGIFRLVGLPNGTYDAFTSNSLGYANEIYNNLPCSGACSTDTAIASGTPIVVTGATADTTDIDFALAAQNAPPRAPTNLRAITTGFTTTFTWTAPSTSNAVAATSYILEAGVAPGSTLVTFPVNGTSFTVSGVPVGSFYVRVRGVNAFGAGPASTDYVLTIRSDGAQPLDAPTNVFAFVSAGRLTMTWAAAPAGGVPTSYVVEAGSATGITNIATLPVNTRSFTFSPVPNGFYFLRVRARTATQLGPPSAEAMIVVGNVAAPPGPPLLGHSVAGSTVTLNWRAPTFGTATSYIVEAGSATGLSNVAVFNTGNANLLFIVNNVPNGTYYVRIRAVNAQGSSIVSNERTIVVGP
jgi:hypothetical protein